MLLVASIVYPASLLLARMRCTRVSSAKSIFLISSCRYEDAIATQKRNRVAQRSALRFRERSSRFARRNRATDSFKCRYFSAASREQKEDILAQIQPRDCCAGGRPMPFSISKLLSCTAFSIFFLLAYRTRFDRVVSNTLYYYELQGRSLFSSG